MNLEPPFDLNSSSVPVKWARGHIQTIEQHYCCIVSIIGLFTHADLFEMWVGRLSG